MLWIFTLASLATCQSYYYLPELYVCDSSVEAVPTKWISPENNCFWPPFLADKVAQAIKNQDLNTCWPIYKVEIFRNGTYGQYDIARTKARRAEDTSDLNSEVDVESSKNSRRKKNKRYFSSSSEDEQATSGMKSPPRMKILKKKRSTEKGNTVPNPTKNFRCANRVLNFDLDQRFQSNQDSHTDDDVSSGIPHRSTFGQININQNNPASTSSKTTRASWQNTNIGNTVANPIKNFIGNANRVSEIDLDQEYQPNQDSHTDNDVYLGSTLDQIDINRNNPACASSGTTRVSLQNKNIGSLNPPPQPCPCCPVHSTYLRNIIKSQQTNRSVLIEVLEQVKGLETSRAQPPENPTTSVFEEFILPANSLEDISAIDNYLQSEEVFSKAVEETSRLGGKTNYDTVRRILGFF